MGLLLYDLTVIGTFFLGTLLWQRGAWRRHLAFFAYIAFCCVRAFALHPLLRSHASGYDDAFWLGQLIALPLIGAAGGELSEHRVIGGITGAAAALSAGFLMLSAKAFLATGDRAGAMAQALLSVDVIKYSGLLLAVMALFAVRGISGIASGLVVSLTFSSLALMAQGPIRYASTAAWIVALVLWLDWVRTYRVDLTSRGTISAMKYDPLKRGRGNGLVQRKRPAPWPRGLYGHLGSHRWSERRAQ